MILRIWVEFMLINLKMVSGSGLKRKKFPEFYNFLSILVLNFFNKGLHFYELFYDAKSIYHND